MDEAVAVFLWPEKPVGNLWFRSSSGRQSASFEYHPGWLADKQNSFALEPGLELYPGVFHTQNLPIFGSLGDSAPDRWGRALLLRREQRQAKELGRTPKTLTELDYLLGINDETRQGALRFKKQGDEQFLAPNERDSIPPLVSLPKLLTASERFLEAKESDEDLRLLLIGGSSLGGARPKASVYNNNVLSIAKFPKKDDDIQITLWEALALSLARKADIQVPEWHITKILGKPVLILKRFDRQKKQRIPFISAMSMLGAKDHEQHSYLEIAHAIIRYGAEPTRDLEELWKRMVFNISISNIDDHLRNHGFLLNTPKGWELSPAYDLNPVPRQEKANFHSLAINQTSREGSVEVAFSVIDEFRIKKDKAESILADIRRSLSGWQNTARSLGISRQEIDRMESAFIK
ncbi:MAG: type II toxin-antitoxin system HipA family toxin [Treponema sp.]|jgi:serine/threonine-protein kinase HipA|nr:type II toxin-antitoxin system HipA family toxin [Treponema sp.]